MHNVEEGPAKDLENVQHEHLCYRLILLMGICKVYFMCDSEDV